MSLHKTQPARSVRLTDDASELSWRAGTKDVEVNPATVLREFIRLRDGAGVARLAAKYGALGVCEHGLPSAHHRPAWGDDTTGRECRPIRRGRRFVEPVGAWLRLADEARTVIALTEAFRAGHDSREHYEALAPFVAAPRHAAEDSGFRAATGITYDASPAGGEGEEFGELVARWMVDRWCRLGDVRPRVEWRDGRFVSHLSGEGLMGVLALGLLAEVDRELRGATRAYAPDTLTCSSCGELYVPKRMPPPGKDNYCGKDECRRTRDRRSKQRTRAQARGRKGMGG